jgi:peptidoglycan L-alanyl-D-glutamate endopeptidase CwlK
MPKFSNTSIQRLEQCHEDLQRLFNSVIEEVDIIILQGYRGEKEQNAAYARGASKLKYPNSKHNKIPSLAVDVAPYPLDWKNIQAFKDLSVIVKAHMKKLGIKNVEWGGEIWDKFRDFPHWQIKKGME